MANKKCIAIGIIVFSLLMLIYTSNVYASMFHIMGGSRNSQIVWRDQVYLASVDITYFGASDSNIFTDVVLFQLSNYNIDLTVPNETTLRIELTPPIDYDPIIPEYELTTFTTIVDWGVPGGASPFTFIEYDPTGQIVGQGTIMNTPEPNTFFLLSCGLLSLLLIQRGKIKQV